MALLGCVSDGDDDDQGDNLLLTHHLTDSKSAIEVDVGKVMMVELDGETDQIACITTAPHN